MIWLLIKFNGCSFKVSLTSVEGLPIIHRLGLGYPTDLKYEGFCKFFFFKNCPIWVVFLYFALMSEHPDAIGGCGSSRRR